MPTIPLIFALVAFAGIFLLFFGISRMRRSAGGADAFHSILSAYVFSPSFSSPLPPSICLILTLTRLFHPSPARIGFSYPK